MLVPYPNQRLPIGPPQMDNSNGRPKENHSFLSARGQIVWNGLKWGQYDLLQLIHTLLTFWATHILISITVILMFFGILKFPDSQVCRFSCAASAGAGRTLRSQPDSSPNAPRDQIRRKALAAMLAWLVLRGAWIGFQSA